MKRMQQNKSKILVCACWTPGHCPCLQILNLVPGRLGRKLHPPFKLVHDQNPNLLARFKLFPVEYVMSQDGNTNARSNA